ncbi:MAG: metal-dependent transcriptional regulator [Nitrospinae bacterium]|nr:metal-dependent transcriptional regulator [Nitrospinota bacterium]MCY4383153.1 metal-dependent transcriptional regulator [Nitrospinota bacterium]
MTPQPQHSRGSLSPSLEHYLRAIFDLQESKGYARVTDIASMLGVAKPAVSAAVKTLRSNGLVSHRVYESILLTEEGAKRAKSVSGKFSILMHFLIDVLGVEEEQAFVDACVMEHYVSGNSIDRFLDLLRFFEEHGNQEILEKFHQFRRSCESVDTCPTCSYHCDISVIDFDDMSQKIKQSKRRV